MSASQFVSFLDFTERENRKNFFTQYGQLIVESLETFLPTISEDVCAGVMNDVWIDAKAGIVAQYKAKDILESVSQSPTLLNYLQKIKNHKAR